jgi:hypothetical protein
MKMILAGFLAVFLLAGCGSSPNLPTCTGSPTDRPGKNCQLGFSQKLPDCSGAASDQPGKNCQSVPQK